MTEQIQQQDVLYEYIITLVQSKLIFDKIATYII